MATTQCDRPLGLLEYVYPVGAIYISVNSTSPADLFGGTWERIQDRMLLGAGSTYSAGNTGGAASVSYTPAGSNSGGSVGNTTLTVDQIPSHNHSFTGSAVTSGNNSVGHTHTYTDYYATTTGNTAITVAQMPSHDHGGYTGYYQPSVRHQHGGAAVGTCLNYSTSTPSQFDNYSYIENHRHTISSQGSTNNHNHSGANTSSSRTSNGISANHTHSVTASGSIGNKGGGKAHNHGFTNPTFSGTKATINVMNPYLVVYMWKRTA